MRHLLLGILLLSSFFVFGSMAKAETCTITEKMACIQGHVWSINHRDCVNFDQVVGGQARHAKHHVSWFAISEQPYPSLFDDRQRR
jgi:hypothetical protein